MGQRAVLQRRQGAVPRLQCRRRRGGARRCPCHILLLPPISATSCNPAHVTPPCHCYPQVELYDKAGVALPGAQPLSPSDVAGEGTIYNQARLTLALRQAGRGRECVVAGGWMHTQPRASTCPGLSPPASQPASPACPPPIRAHSQLTNDSAPGQFRFQVVAVGGPSEWPAQELSPVVTVGECAPVASNGSGKGWGCAPVLQLSIALACACAPLLPETEPARRPDPTSTPPLPLPPHGAGVPATPNITSFGGGLASANLSWSASPTSAYYLVELLFGGEVKHAARVAHRWAAGRCTEGASVRPCCGRTALQSAAASRRVTASAPLCRPHFPLPLPAPARPCSAATPRLPTPTPLTRWPLAPTPSA